MSDQALAGLKILDLTHYIAGPYCTKILAGLGADVIKVERPGTGDGARRLTPFFHDQPHPERSLRFLFLNAGKKSITLNLKSRTGVRIIRELAKDADLLVENFRPGVMSSLGLGFETLKQINPGLIMTSISNFGQTGPYRDFKGADLVAYATGGLMYTSGSYDREPLKHGLSQAQIVAGANAVVGALTALYWREEAGIAQHVDVSLQESVIGMQASMPMTYGYQGGIVRRQPRRGSGLGNIMPCKDGYFVPVNVGLDWELFKVLVDAPELEDPKFADPPSRTLYGAELDAILRVEFAKRTKNDLFHDSQAFRFAWASVQDPQELVDCPQLNARDFFAEIEHPEIGIAKLPSAPLKMSGTPWEVTRPAPLLGQHNSEIYCDRLGYSREDLVRLRAQDVI